MKEQILQEIRRLAEATGSSPGKRTFERATGIKEHTWRGVFWARWTDALNEAGFEGNEMQIPYTTESVLGSIAVACRHYGRFPTTHELMLFGRDKPSFPGEKAIRKRFPKRSDLLKALIDYVEKIEMLEDVARLLPKPKESSVSPDEKAVEGAVYLLKSGSHYKIGRSDRIEQRVKEIRIALPESIALIHLIRTDDPSGIEAYWHRRFTDLRANGEWFKLGAKEVAAFRRRKYQ